MKCIGMLGGMSWESSLEYYRLFNEGVKTGLGGLHSAKVLLHSVDFQVFADMLSAGDWDGIAQALIDAARGLEAAGAECMLIATNTMHKVAPQVQAAIDIPLIHIAKASAAAIAAQGLTTVGLLGTRFTMEEAFYRDALAEAGIAALIPGEADRGMINRVIFEELCLGRFEDAARKDYLRVMDGLAAQGAQGMVLGCTEIPILVRPEDTSLKLFDTTRLHVQAALDFALA